jgi:hypothetical protein
MIALLGPEPGQGQGIFLLAPVTGIEPEILIQGLVVILGYNGEVLSCPAGVEILFIFVKF